MFVDLCLMRYSIQLRYSHNMGINWHYTSKGQSKHFRICYIDLRFSLVNSPLPLTVKVNFQELKIARVCMKLGSLYIKPVKLKQSNIYQSTGLSTLIINKWPKSQINLSSKCWVLPTGKCCCIHPIITSQ